MQITSSPERVTVCCQFCSNLFLTPRPLFKDERKIAVCPECCAKAEVNTEKMRDAAHRIREESHAG